MVVVLREALEELGAGVEVRDAASRGALAVLVSPESAGGGCVLTPVLLLAGSGADVGEKRGSSGAACDVWGIRWHAACFWALSLAIGPFLGIVI